MYHKLIKYNEIFQKLGFDESFYSGFLDALEIDVQYSNHKNLRKKAHHSKYFLLNAFLIFNYLLISNIVYSFFQIIFYRNSKRLLEKSDNIFIPFPDKKYIRFKLIPQIFPDDHLLLYPPTFSFKSTYLHLKYFQRNKSNIIASSFGFFTPFRFIYKSIKVLKDIRRINKKLTKAEISFYNDYLQIPILVSLSYKIYFERIMSKIPNNGKKKNWFFDFDKDYKYLSFNYVIKTNRKYDNTIHIQHGLFWNEDLCFVKPNTDFIFCCSKREKILIEKTVDNPDRAIVVGAPLQTFSNEVIIDSFQTNRIKKKILILLTICVHKEEIELQKGVIQHLQELGESLKIRFRPASKIQDERIITPILNDRSEISIDASLSQDIMDARFVISFSEDSLLECFRLSKTIYFGSSSSPNFFLENLNEKMPFYPFLSSVEFEQLYQDKNFIANFIWSDNYFVKDNFGSNSIDVVFEGYINALQKMKYLVP